MFEFSQELLIPVRRVRLTEAHNDMPQVQELLDGHRLVPVPVASPHDTGVRILEQPLGWVPSRDVTLGDNQKIKPARFEVFHCTPPYGQEFESDSRGFELHVTQDVGEQIVVAQSDAAIEK